MSKKKDATPRDEYITVMQAGKHSRILLSELHDKGGVWLTNNAFVYNSVEVPTVRHQLARKDGKEKRWHVFSAGGLGDQICATSLTDYLHEVLKAEEILVSCHYPEIYYGKEHVHAIKIGSDEYLNLNWYNYFSVETLVYHTRPHSDWLSLHMINCMDVAPLVALGRTLPSKYRVVELFYPPETTLSETLDGVPYADRVILHPGLTWPSRTIPEWWWNEVICTLRSQGKTPILIGAQCPNGNSTVEGINTDGCLDYRNKLSFHQTLKLMDMSPIVVTNDSAPYHMACSFPHNKVLVLSTGRPFDYIKHDRIRVYNIERGCKLETIDLNTRSNNVNIYSHCTEEEMKSWLPNPSEFVHNYFGR